MLSVFDVHGWRVLNFPATTVPLPPAHTTLALSAALLIPSLSVLFHFTLLPCSSLPNCTPCGHPLVSLLPSSCCSSASPAFLSSLLPKADSSSSPSLPLEVPSSTLRTFNSPHFIPQVKQTTQQQQQQQSRRPEESHEDPDPHMEMELDPALSLLPLPSLPVRRARRVSGS